MTSLNQASGDSDAPNVGTTTEAPESLNSRRIIRPVFRLNDEDINESTTEALALLQRRVDMLVSMQLDLAGDDLEAESRLNGMVLFNILYERAKGISALRASVKNASIERAPITDASDQDLSELAIDTNPKTKSQFMPEGPMASDLIIPPLSREDLEYLTGRLDLFLHDIGTPITSLKLAMQILERKINKAIMSGDTQASSVDLSSLYNTSIPIARQLYGVINMLLLYLGIECNNNEAVLVTGEDLVEYYGNTSAAKNFVDTYPMVATSLRLNLEQNVKRYGENVDNQGVETKGYCNVCEIDLNGKKYYLLVAMDNGEGYPPELVEANSFIRGRIDHRSKDSTGIGMFGVQQLIVKEDGAWRITNDLLVRALDRGTEADRFYPKFSDGELATLPDDLIIEYARQGYRGACLMVLLPVV